MRTLNGDLLPIWSIHNLWAEDRKHTPYAMRVTTLCLSGISIHETCFVVSPPLVTFS